MRSKSRFAPSPTGLLHIGNARSAVLNWTYINSVGGEFILRIDDTDLDRSTKEFKNEIINDLQWLGINWSKVFSQSSRSDLYNEKINLLKNKKRIYPCFETTEELNLKRKILLSAGNPPIYDRSALKLTENQINDNLKQGKKPHWRFRLEDKIIEWNDIIKGKVSFDSSKLSDPILIREDETLLYHLPSVIDDIEEKITDVIRGEDHISNTAFHIQIFEALESPIPKFGHHPFLVDEQGKNFGKRLGSYSIKKLKDEGFENITLMNYLLSIGTNKNFSKEKKIKNLIKNFDIKNLTSSPPKFSHDSLVLLNREILQTYNFSEILDKLKNYNIENAKEDFWLFAKNNISFFSDVLNWWEIVKSDKLFPIDYNDKNFYKIAAKLLPLEPFDQTTWKKWTLAISKETNKTGRELYMPLRIALTGKKDGPELKYLIPLLDRKKILAKLGS